MRRILVAIAFFAALPVSAALAEKGADDALAAITTAVDACEYDRALELAKTFSAKSPACNDLVDVLFRAGAGCVKEMQLAPAAGFYRLLVDTFPESERAGDARSELVACYTFLRQLDACIAQAKTNLELEPDSRWAEYWHFLIAQSHFRLWNFTEAKTSLEAFLAKYPNGEYAKNARSCLRQIDPPWKIDEHGIVSYSGKYDTDIRLQAAIQALPADLSAGFRTLEERLGLDLEPHTNVIFVFKDAENNTSGGLKASTFVIGRNNKPAIVIRLYTEYVVAQQANHRMTIVHELKHAGFQGIMGHPYDDLPKWIREGLAVWGSGDVDSRLQLVLCNEIVAGRDPMKVLDGVDDPDHDVKDYLEDGLAFEWFASKNPDNVKAFCRRLVKGESCRAIWADLSGMSYNDAVQEANAYCRRRVTSALGEAYTVFVALRKAHDDSIKQGADASRKWLQEGGKAAFENWLTANPGHPAEPFARFCLARSLITAGQHTPGRDLLQRILDEDCLRCTLLDDAQLWIGVSYNRQRDLVNERAAFGVVLRDFSYSYSAKQVAGKFPAAGPVTH